MLFLRPTQKRFLSSLNPLVMVAIVGFAVTFRTTVVPWLPIGIAAWDALFALVVYFGQRRHLMEGVLLTFFSAHFYSLASSAPIGIFVIYYGLLFTVARLLAYVVYANSLWSVTGLLFVLSLYSKFGLWIIARSFGHPIYSIQTLGQWVVYMFVNTVLGLLIYAFIGFVDRLTFKVQRENIEMAEDAL